MTAGAKKILVVDDETGIVDELKDYLIEEGYEVRTALDGAEGLSLLESFRPHLVITDLKLPDIPGLEILRMAREKFPEIKIIVSTGYVDQGLIDEAERLGRDAFIQKPFDLEFVKREIEKLI